MLFFIDSSLVLHNVINVHNQCRLTDDGILALVKDTICSLVINATDPKDVVVAVEGVATADVVERRRREAYACAHAGRLSSPPHCGTLSHKALPGTRFTEKLVRLLEAEGWTVRSEGGPCLVTIARGLRQATDEFTMFLSDRDADAIISLSPSHSLHILWKEGQQRSYRPCKNLVGDNAEAHARNCADAVVLDILTGGGGGGIRTGHLVQDLPGLPRMPGTFASEAMQRTYDSWSGGASGTRPKWLTVRCPDVDHVFCLDRMALVEMLTRYTEADGGENDDENASNGWTGVGWRKTHSEAGFPHGFDGACVQYLDAIDRELCHLSGSTVNEHRSGVYVHACAPSALDLVNNVSQIDKRRQASLSMPVNLWPEKMQLSAILPRTGADCVPDDSIDRTAVALHTRLEFGCVHMFPVTYRVWWGTYPLIPAIDFELFASGYAQAHALTHAHAHAS